MTESSKANTYIALQFFILPRGILIAKFFVGGFTNGKFDPKTLSSCWILMSSCLFSLSYTKSKYDESQITCHVIVLLTCYLTNNLKK